jgi:hypothetical protein
LFFDGLKARLIGHKVTYRRLACDSLLLFIDCDPGDGTGVTLWFEPIWHYSGPNGVLVGSMLVAEASDSEEAMAAVADEPMALLLGRSIESVTIAPRTFDLMVTFEGDYHVTTFVSDPTSDESWHIRDNTTRLRLKGSPRGLSVVLVKSQSR